jgi:hypothetical protein
LGEIASETKLKYGPNLNFSVSMNSAHTTISLLNSKVLQFNSTTDIVYNPSEESPIIWIPTSKIFPTIDLLITVKDQVYFISITISKSHHSIVLKSSKNLKKIEKNFKKSRKHRTITEPVEFSGLLPMIFDLINNGFSKNLKKEIFFVWGLPEIKIFPSSLPITIIFKGIELLNSEERKLFCRLKIIDFVFIEPKFFFPR